ncbi:sucrase ferredoxin [Phanerochaete sordida]|uniref:Sucrase ferredoxin n=1 Tax=Phanerochaete sordida TaxID=48140 RepID=A0A9P3FXM1_9APHY|nr:sucrase ferredoxin [Phanerochaete sordida]
MTSQLRKLKAIVLGHNLDMDSTTANLEEANVPVSRDECRACADPCDLGHEDYPSRFEVDMETEMLGSMKPYRRQVVISTGKSDWAHDVSSVSGSLASYLDSALSSAPKPPKTGGAGSKVSGVYDSAESARVTVLNGSHHTLSDNPKNDTVLVLPDYKVVTEVPRSREGAAELFRDVVDPALPRAGAHVDGAELQSYVLPYSSVILLCSHKKRDNRCAIAAPKLQHALTIALEREGWDVHTQLEDPADHGAPLEEHAGSPDARDAEFAARLRAFDPATADPRRALILMVSHIGGHKFAGNVIIYKPQGVSVWYGRVTPHHCEAIVRDTIVGGKVLPPLLRGGLNLSRPGRTSLNDW